MTHLLPFCLLSAGIMFINHQYRREYSCMAENPMRRDDNLLEQIQSRLESLNKSERKVADAILRDPSAATRYSIAALARAANVSEPTVNRFCRGFSATGFPDFKIRLAQSIATGTPYVGQDIEPDDTPAEYAEKIMLSTIANLDKTRQALDPQDIATVVDYLIQAKQIAFFGMGGSASVALDRKSTRLNSSHVRISYAVFCLKKKKKS